MNAPYFVSVIPNYEGLEQKRKGDQLNAVNAPYFVSVTPNYEGLEQKRKGNLLNAVNSPYFVSVIPNYEGLEQKQKRRSARHHELALLRFGHTELRRAGAEKKRGSVKRRERDPSGYRVGDSGKVLRHAGGTRPPVFGPAQ